MSDSMDAADFVRLGQKKRAKYGNVKTEVDGFTFDSIAEAERYKELRLMQRVGAISGLGIQPDFPLVVNGVTICRYVADFMYRDTATGREVIEDVKGVRTAAYRLKRKLMQACHGIIVQEIDA